uniref:Uncharacterized protein n=1 Tax=Solanum tuberosum TaxID=4113 RepID=M1DDQ5_SOLTU
MEKIEFLVIYVLPRLSHYGANLFRPDAAALVASCPLWQDSGLEFPEFLFLLINDGSGHYNRYQFTPRSSPNDKCSGTILEDRKKTETTYEETKVVNYIVWLAKAVAFPLMWGHCGEDPTAVAGDRKQSGSTSRGKMRRTGRASSSKAAVNSDDEDPFSGARDEVDLETIWKKMGSAYANLTSVPPSTALEVEMLHRQLRHERRKGVDMDRLMI